MRVLPCVCAGAQVQAVSADPDTHKLAKTDRMNELLNYGIPYFRCSDFDLVKVCYCLLPYY